MKKLGRYLVLALELGLAALFMWGGINVLLSDEHVVTPNKILEVLTNSTAIVFYGLWFFNQGFMLMIGNLTGAVKLQAWALMSMYLTCLYVLILSMLLEGLTTGLITTVLTGIVSAALYLRIKYQYRTTHRHRK